MKLICMFLTIVVGIAVLARRGYYKETVNVVATIVEKQYEPASTYLAPVLVGKVTTVQTKYRPAKYEVTLEYKGNLYLIDDAELFEEYDVSDKVNCVLVTTYNKKRKVVDVSLEQGWDEQAANVIKLFL